MNKIELANAIQKIAEGFHLTDWESEDDLEKAFRETIDILCDYDEKGIMSIIDGLKNEYQAAVDEGWNEDPEYDETFTLCALVIADLYELLEDCYSGEDEDSTKCKVVRSIMNDSNLEDSAKVWKTQMYLKGWLTKEQATRC